MKAVWNEKVIARSNATIVVENNHYFPANSVNKEYLQDSDTITVCPWKGTASYYSLVVDGEVNKDAAWYYADPKPEAKQIQNYVAFWKGVKIVKEYIL